VLSLALFETVAEKYLKGLTTPKETVQIDEFEIVFGGAK
jgi:hypothetical protein